MHAGIVLPFGDGLWERERTSEVGFNKSQREREETVCWLMSDRTR